MHITPSCLPFHNLTPKKPVQWMPLLHQSLSIVPPRSGKSGSSLPAFSSYASISKFQHMKCSVCPSGDRVLTAKSAHHADAIHALRASCTCSYLLLRCIPCMPMWWQPSTGCLGDPDISWTHLEASLPPVRLLAAFSLAASANPAHQRGHAMTHALQRCICIGPNTMLRARARYESRKGVVPCLLQLVYENALVYSRP